jgi:hypothetical protein
LWNLRLPVLALSAAVLCGSSAFAAEPKTSPKEIASFGTLTAPTEEVAKAKTVAWLKSAGKDDADTMKQVDAIWASDRVLLDKVADSLCLGNADAAKLMAEARDVNAPAPVETPAILKDTKQPVFFRANLTLAYAKALSTRHIYEEGLEALVLVKGEQVIDPSSYFFHRAVAEFSLMLRRQADESITRLLEDCGDAPDRYKMVAALMHFDMLTWQDKDLGWIARKMDNIQRRLDLNRGGQQTQKMQREVLVRLDEMIKEKENQQKQQGQGQGQGQGNGGNCPPGGSGQSGPPNGSRPSGNPASDFGLPNGSNAGLVDPQKVGELAKNWGTLPEKERAKAMLELTRGLDPKYREAIEMYVKEMARKSAEGSQK